jgi:hypothetical protein
MTMGDLFANPLVTVDVANIQAIRMDIIGKLLKGTSR